LRWIRYFCDITSQAAASVASTPTVFLVSLFVTIYRQKTYKTKAVTVEKSAEKPAAGGAWRNIFLKACF
jgi:hypothetical protein